ncbi:MAG TPA: hypothetical protein VMD59_20185 [Acidimicrobiales bacterium]|nr:hypothetical protein [Acidimicrobiales bacterium]
MAIREAKVIDLEADEVTLRFRLAPVPDPDWERLFEQAADREARLPGRTAVGFASPAVIAGIVTCKVAAPLVPAARLKMVELVEAVNGQFASLVEQRASRVAFRAEQARLRRHALAAAQQLLDHSASIGVVGA